MKKILFAIVLASMVIAFITFWINEETKITETIYQKPRSGLAIIMTGAAARIPQEAALLEELDKRGMLKDLVFISGVSSGALNSVLLNGILSNKISWKEYKDILFNLKNSDIYIQDKKKIPVNTSPARSLFVKIVEDRMGFFSIDDLPYTTSISITELKELVPKKPVYRMCNRKINEESDTTIGLVNLMMASAAIPIVFPAVRITDATTIPRHEYIDGGLGEDHVPYRALLEFEKFRGFGVAKVIIISRDCDSIPQLSEELKSLGINDRGICDKLGFSIDARLRKGIIKRLKAYCTEAPALVPLTYVWMPDFSADFLLFDFENMKVQYDQTTEWIKTNEPMLIEDFLKKNEKKKK